MFALEYGGWFDFLLPGLEKLKIPIPLGGTSNHFPIRILKEMMAWDPYNVTEDADLGIRLAANGYKTSVMESMTWEEAPIVVSGWMSQRSRWIKGHMQTYFVHMRGEKEFIKEVGPMGYLGFLLFVGGACLVFFSFPFVLTSAVVMFASENTLPQWFINFSQINLLLGIGLHILFALAVIKKYKWFDMIPYSIIFPFYWLLHAFSSFKGVWQLIARPYYWEKTEHGLTKVSLE
jgi:cellulose synthase/poly-beta-1,6-N-acetylglucosamine synthase-like glycosyltransferase